MKRALILVPLVAALAACTSTGEKTASDGSGASTRVTAATPIGPAEDCVQINQIRESRVLSDQVIDFHMNNGRVLRNTLPNACPQLGFERAFSYETSLSRLCSVDIITVLIQGGGITRGASCGLGKFQPVELAGK